MDGELAMDFFAKLQEEDAMNLLVRHRQNASRNHGGGRWTHSGDCVFSKAQPKKWMRQVCFLQCHKDEDAPSFPSPNLQKTYASENKSNPHDFRA